MKNFFNDVFSEATRLTQAGDLQAATELIQRTLRGEASVPSSAPQPGGSTHSGMVIDAVTRVIDEPAPASTTDGSAAPEQWLDGNFSHQGRQITYKLYVPPTAAGTPAPRPLVLMLHGCTQGPDDFATGTRMNALAREAGVLVLYPEQIQHANAHKCWNWFKPQHQQRGRGEPALLAALTQSVIAEHHVDPARVYVAGLSAGGAMADILGRCYPDVFAAVGVHSGLAAGAASDLGAAMAAMRSGAPGGTGSGPAVRPVIVFHGDADSTVHHRNGDAVVEAARRAQQVTQAPRVEQGHGASGQRFTRTQYAGAEGRSAVEHWQLHGAGHAWSGGSAAGSYTAPGGVDASAEMLRFFLSHKRPAAS